MYVSNPTDSVTATFTEAGWSQDMHVVGKNFLHVFNTFINTCIHETYLNVRYSLYTF